MGTVRHVADRDDSLRAQVVARYPLRYAAGADPSLDRPGHVRAGSGLARVPGGLALVQDDAHFVAAIDPASRATRAIPLPFVVEGRRQFDDILGNKAHKLDLEACVAVDGEHGVALLALGSGSTSRREHVAIVSAWDAAEPTVRVVHVPRLYAALRAEHAFAGSELNVEGAVLLGDRLRLFGRGNGAARDGRLPVNATCDLDWATLRAHLADPERNAVPLPADVAQYDLGAIDGVPLTFTDATVWRDGLLYTAAAEASPDAVQDGAVAGSAIGVIDLAGRARWTPLSDADGRPFTGKVEGAAPGDGEDTLWVVVDVDDPTVPSELCAVRLSDGRARGHTF